MPDNKNQITVVVPAFNEEKNLPRLLTSLSRQTYDNFDILVADNNSTDRTAKIIKEYKAERLLVTEKGYVYALSAGLNHAKGKIIAVTDADTLVHKDWLKEIVKAFSDPQVVALTGSIVIGRKDFFSKVLDFLYTAFLYFHFLIGKPHLIGFNFAVRKDVFEEAGGLDERFTMSPDVDLGLRLKQYGKVSFVQKVRVIPSMRRWEDSVIKTFVEYATGYFYTLWFRKPPPVKQAIIRA